MKKNYRKPVWEKFPIAESIEEYFAAQDDFLTNYVRITETGMILIDWDDVTDKEDDVLSKAEKMAEALLSTDQKFIQP